MIRTHKPMAYDLLCCTDKRTDKTGGRTQARQERTAKLLCLTCLTPCCVKVNSPRPPTTTSTKLYWWRLIGMGLSPPVVRASISSVLDAQLDVKCCLQEG